MGGQWQIFIENIPQIVYFTPTYRHHRWNDLLNYLLNTALS